MLTIDLRSLRDGPIELVDDVPGDDGMWSGTGIELADPLHVRVRAEWTTAETVWVRGSLRVVVATVCRRCVEGLELEVAEEFELMFDPRTSKLDEDGSLYALDPGTDELDLHRPLRERVLLQLPSFPVCDPGCRGLCAHCGTELGEDEHECTGSELDPRWGPLLALRTVG